MASFAHIAVGLAAGRRFAERSTARQLTPALLYFPALAMLPDLDVIGFRFHVRYASAFGHRGALHSLCAAAALGTLCGAVVRFRGSSRARTIAWSIAIVASHGLLDTLTDGGLGVALLWPFSARRFFAPWRPIPVAPIGAGMFSARGLHVLAVEALATLPLLVYALWPRKRARRDERR